MEFPLGMTPHTHTHPHTPSPSPSSPHAVVLVKSTGLLQTYIYLFLSLFRWLIGSCVVLTIGSSIISGLFILCSFNTLVAKILSFVMGVGLMAPLSLIHDKLYVPFQCIHCLPVPWCTRTGWSSSLWFRGAIDKFLVHWSHMCNLCW